jgi:broad specificity phosphatase PhoE
MKRKIIWIRHGNKLYCNGKAPEGYHQHDPPLKEDAKEDIYKKVDGLLYEFGFPDRIICSPFLRTRQTVETMLEHLYILNVKKTSNITVEMDMNISEYLGFQKPYFSEADVNKETLDLSKTKIILGESLKSLNFRVKEHISNLNLFDDKSETIWVITHGIILNNVYYSLTKMNGKAKQLPDRPPSLSHVDFTYYPIERKSSLSFDLSI